MGDTSQEVDKNISVVRDDLINTAVKFLQHPNVQKSSLEHREAFLRKKGLSEKEISLAFERSLVALPQIAPQQFHANHPQHTAVNIPGYYLPPPATRWSRFRETLNNFAIVGGLIYGLYLLYKKYIAPFLFGSPSKQPAIQETIRALDDSVRSSVQGLRTELQRVQSDVAKITEQQELSRNHATARQMLELKNEVISLKGLLLNRNQFTASSLEPPSIPAWQLESEEAVDIKVDEESVSLTTSDSELVTNNGSDSSLEMIKE